MQKDLNFFFGDFSSVEVKVEAVSPKGREFFSAMFGAGAVSVNLPKSRAGDLAEYASRKGLSVN